jgi:ABC-type transport system involved in cytochrome bd biosynthesis fused ATPase/permease subunit
VVCLQLAARGDEEMRQVIMSPFYLSVNVRFKVFILPSLKRRIDTMMVHSSYAKILNDIRKSVYESILYE